MSAGDDDLFERLVGECAERMASEGAPALDDLCARHPVHAAALRAAMQPLLAFGVVGAQADDGTVRPDALGEFELGCEIGRGGMGVVYEARQRSLDRPVALKVLHPHLTLDQTTIERFRREGRTAAALKHPGIVDVYGSGEEAGHGYLAMELIIGAPLDLLLRELRQLPGKPSGDDLRAALGRVLEDRGDDQVEVSWSPESAIAGWVEVTRAVALALDHAHRAGVVHRDIKPSNILLRPDGRPVLTDFGLARDRDMPGLTQSGTLAGTPFYMSPEQTAGTSAELDQRSDLFSLGATLYELLTRARPFPGDSSQQVMLDIQRREPIDPQRLRPELPDDLTAIVLKALEKDPDDRYPSAEAMARDLEAFAQLRPVSARKASTWRRLRRWTRREPLKAAVAALLLVGVPTVTALAGFVWAQRPMVERAERQQALDAAEASLMQGHFEMVHGRRERSEELFRRALAEDATHFEALAGIVLGLATDEAGSRQALELIDAEVAGGELDRPRRRLQAICYENMGRRDQSDQVLRTLGEPVEPFEHFLEGWRLWRRDAASGKDLRAAYERFLSAVLLTPAPRAIFHHRLALVAGDLGEERAARRSAEALQRFWPDSPFAWEGVGLALETIDPAAAIDAYRRAIELDDEGRATIHGNLALACYLTGDADSAITEYQTALRLRADNGFAHYGLAKVYLYLEPDLGLALEHARQASLLAGDDPFRTDHHRIYMRALVRAGRAGDAVAVGEEALRSQPDSVPLLCELAGTQMNIPDAEAATRLCERALLIDPDDPDALELLADARATLGDHQAAVATQRRIAELQPRNPEGWRLVATRQLFKLPDGSRFDPEGAVQNAERARLLLTEDDPYMLYTLANAYQACGRLDQAAAALDEAVKVAALERWQSDSDIAERLRRARQLLDELRATPR